MVVGVGSTVFTRDQLRAHTGAEEGTLCKGKSIQSQMGGHFTGPQITCHIDLPSNTYENAFLSLMTFIQVPSIARWAMIMPRK